MSAREQDMDNEAAREAAYDYFRKVGIMEPTPDMIGQMTDAFLPCLRIMYERGYDPEGSTWRNKGWRGLVHDILNKAGRLKFHSWRHSRFDPDSARDIINFAGFYLRLENQGRPWGEWGEPG